MSSPVRVSAVDVFKGLTLFRTTDRRRETTPSTNDRVPVLTTSSADDTSRKKVLQSAGTGVKTLSLD